MFMPGSRKTEIMNLMPIYKEVAQQIQDKTPVLVIPEKFDEAYIKKFMEIFQILKFLVTPIKL